MPKLTLFTLLVALVVVGSAVAWTFRERVPFRPGEPAPAPTATGIATKSGSDALVDEQADSVAQLTKEFGEHYTQALFQRDEAAARAAKDLLSEHGRNVVETDADAIAGLKRLTSNLGAPQHIEVTTSRRQSEHFAEATVSWNYGTMRLPRYVYFTLEGGVWKLDSIQEVKQ